MASALVERLDPEARAYVERLEKYALDGYCGRCDGCSLVFDYDEGEHGEDCWLCKSCVAEARAEYARTLARAVAAGEACTCGGGNARDGCCPHLRGEDCAPLREVSQRSAPTLDPLQEAAGGFEAMHRSAPAPAPNE